LTGKGFWIFWLIGVLVGSPVVGVSINIPDPYFGVSGSDVTRIVYVKNPSDQLKAVELVVKSRRYSLDGEEILVDTEDFIVHPSQLLLKPQESVVVTVSWIGQTVPKIELPFRIVTEELEVPNQKKQVEKKGVSLSLNVRFKYVYKLYVRPAGVKADVVLEKAGFNPTRNALEVILRNQGTAHQVIKKSFFRFSGAGRSHSQVYEGEAWRPINILPGGRRRLFLEWPQEVPSQNGRTVSLISFQ